MHQYSFASFIAWLSHNVSAISSWPFNHLDSQIRTTKAMYGSTLLQIWLYAMPLVHGNPFSFPLPNGFPFPGEAALEELYTTAGGNFTNMPLAPKFDSDSLTSWKLQAFNEFMEVAFFTQLIANITDGVPGYKLHPESKDYILNTLKTIQAVSLRFFIRITAEPESSNYSTKKQSTSRGMHDCD